MAAFTNPTKAKPPARIRRQGRMNLNAYKADGDVPDVYAFSAPRATFLRG